MKLLLPPVDLWDLFGEASKFVFTFLESIDFLLHISVLYKVVSLLPNIVFIQFVAELFYRVCSE